MPDRAGGRGKRRTGRGDGVIEDSAGEKRGGRGIKLWFFSRSLAHHQATNTNVKNQLEQPDTETSITTTSQRRV